MAVQAFLISLTSAVLIALGIVLSRFGLRRMGPLRGGSISVPTSAAMFLLLSPLTVDYANWHPRAAAIFAAAGLIYPAAVTLLNFASNQRLGPNLTAAMGNLTPLFAIGLAMMTLGEWPRMTQATGIATVIAGLFLVTLAQVRHSPRAHLWLLAIPLLGAFLRGAAQPLVKLGLNDWPNAFAAAMLSYAVSALVIWAVRLIRPPAPIPPDPIGRAWFVLIGIVNGLALLTLYIALSHGSVTLVAPIVASYPLITMGLTWLLHGREPLSWRALLGMAVSVLGAVLILRG